MKQALIEFNDGSRIIFNDVFTHSHLENIQIIFKRKELGLDNQSEKSRNEKCEQRLIIPNNAIKYILYSDDNEILPVELEYSRRHVALCPHCGGTLPEIVNRDVC